MAQDRSPIGLSQCAFIESKRANVVKMLGITAVKLQIFLAIEYQFQIRCWQAVGERLGKPLAEWMVFTNIPSGINTKAANSANAVASIQRGQRLLPCIVLPVGKVAYRYGP